MSKIAAWILVIVTILGFVIFYAYFIPVYKENTDDVDDEVGTELTGDALTTYEKNKAAFNNMVTNSLSLVILSMLIYGFLSSQRKERVEGYYG